MTNTWVLKVCIAGALCAVAANVSAQSSEAQSLEEVRNTVINLLEALVQRGVMTREQAESLVSEAQQKATADAQARAAQDRAEAGAVRVTYVPEIVRQQISAEVAAEVKDDVASQVVAEAKADGWGVPGALPEWIKGVRLYGDVRARAQGDLYASDNVQNVYLNFNEVNAAGGVAAAGVNALLNVSDDRNRLVGRVRTGLRADLGNAFKLDLGVASGNIRSPVSTNQTLGNYGGQWEVNVDRAAVLWNPINAARDQELDLRFGRFTNPFVSMSELVWDNDLTFEGLSATYALDLLGTRAEMERSLFLTVGAFPLQEVELSTDDKWLYAGQLGFEVGFGNDSRVGIAGSYLKYDNITGVRNELDSEVFDFTAPAFLQKGNTLFDIRTSDDPRLNLFALAGEYEIAQGSIWLDLGFGSTHVRLAGEYVKNMAWDSADVLARTGSWLEERTEGYSAAITVGRPSLSALWHWRASASYRYIQRDAVLDAFTDSDFHLGGTDAKGYQIGFDLGLSRGAWLRLRYLTANEIDGPPLGIDVWQLDLNGSF